MMSKSSKLRLFALTAFAVSFAFSDGIASAQIAGGDFATPVAQQRVPMNVGAQPVIQAPITQQQSTSKPKSSFNTIPFRANANGSFSKNQTARIEPARIEPARTTGRPTIRLNSPTNSPLRRNETTSQQKHLIPPPTASSNAPATNVSPTRKIPAKPASFSARPKGTPATTSPQLNLQDGQSQDDPVGSTSMAKFHDFKYKCLVNFIDDIKLPAQVAGVIESLNVKEGDSIKAGAIVGMIDDELTQRLSDQAKLRFEMAQEAADDTTGIRAAEKKYKVAGIEAGKTERLARSGSKSESDRMMANYTKDIALLEQEKAVKEQQRSIGEKRLAAAQYLEAQTRLKQHIIRSDYNASVIEIYKKPQEYVQPGEEVMRIARMDRLWVQGTIESSVLNPYEVKGRRVTVTATLAHKKTETFEGTITNVSLEAQGGTTFLVKAEVTNRLVGEHWVLHPLSKVDMRIHLDDSAQGGSFNTAKQR